MSNALSSNGKREAKISPVCNKCRERHLKCDGGPQCSRCKHEGASCHFRPSRRGMRPLSRRMPTPTSDDGSSDVVAKSPKRTLSQRPILAATDNRAVLLSVSPDPRSGPRSRSRSTISADISIYLTDLFYTHFYPANPFVLPREELVKELAAVEHCPLQPVIEYIGAFYDATFSTSGYQNQAEVLLSRGQCPSDGSLVQALLLFAIGLRMDRCFAKAAAFLQRAKNCAITIGMNDPGFSCLGPGGRVIQVESWSRTWMALQELNQSWQESSNLSTTMTDLSRCTTISSAAALEITAPFDYLTPSTLSTTWKGLEVSPSTMPGCFQTHPNVSNPYNSVNGNDDNIRAVDELRAEAGIYDDVEPHSLAKDGTDWRDYQNGHSTAQENRIAMEEIDFTRMLF